MRCTCGEFKRVMVRSLLSFMFFFQAAKEAKAKIPPWEMFKQETDKYSKFDEQVCFIKIFVSNTLTAF